MEFVLKPFKIISYSNSAIDLFIFRISDLREYLAKFGSYLSHDECIRSSRFLLSHKKEEFILCRGVLRHLIWQYTNVHPSEIKFTYTKYGKPFLESPKKIFFNLSHSHNLVAIAFSPLFDLGIDVEQANLHVDIDQLAKQICTINEYVSFEKMSPEKRADFFYNLWVTKEACLKALGTGMQCDIKKFSSEIFQFQNPHGNIFSLNQDLAILNENYKGAVAIL